MKRICVSVLSIACLFMVNMAQAETININIISETGGNNNNPQDQAVRNTILNGTAWTSSVSPVNAQGTIWNDLLATPDGTDLTGSDSSTGVDVALTLGPNMSAFDWADGDVDVLMLRNYFAGHKGFGGAPGLSTLDFSDLGAGSKWDVYIISQGDGNGQGGEFQIGGTAKTSLGDLAGAGSTTNGFVEGRNYVKFAGVEAPAGSISVTFGVIGGINNPRATGFAAIDGIQLVRIPEPSTSALAVLSLLAMAAFGRRKK